MKVKVKYLVIAVAVIMITGKIAINRLNPKPIKFENFKTAEALIAFLNEQYPTQTQSSKLITELKLTGSACKVIDKKHYTRDTPKNCKTMYYCTYNTGWISYPLLIDYTVGVYEDAEGKLIRLNVGMQYAGP